MNYFYKIDTLFNNNLMFIKKKSHKIKISMKRKKDLKAILKGMENICICLKGILNDDKDKTHIHAR